MADKRLFFAVEVPPPRAEGFTFAEAPPHLTLRFLGDVPEEQVPTLVRCAEEALRDLPAFRLVLRGAGVFPGPARPRVLWAGVGEGAEEVGRLAERLSASLLGLGWPLEKRPFVPHLTLLRIRNREEAERARRTVAELAGRELGSTEIRAVLLKESTLTPNGAIHGTIATIPLAEAPGAVGPAPSSGGERYH